jgi:vacuolar-type H+-ATPase subunit E/Vma4
MRKNILPLCASAALLLSSCASYQRVGTMTMISTRNVENKGEYVLVQKNVEGIAKMKDNDSFQQAIDNAVRKYANGEHIRNATVYVRGNGKRIKVTGDVWGTPLSAAATSFAAGDRVAFKSKTEKGEGRIIEGKVIGINEREAIVEYTNLVGITTRADIRLESLTKLN